MPPNVEPIPPERLPPGWGAVDHGAERFVYCRNESPIELIAARTAPELSHPALGLGHCWELRYRHAVGEVPVVERIGCVSTRHAALEGLVECMYRVHDRAENPADPFEVRAVLDGVRLRDLIPDMRSTHSL